MALEMEEALSLSLERADDQPTSLLTYLISALQMVRRGWGKRAFASAGGAAAADRILASAMARSA
jgi:ATP/maltotriose-dependent transcriptional regulator MalT